MFGSIVLEVAIGVAFLYLLLSLLCTSLQEAIAGLLRWRSKHLFKGLGILLGPSFASRLYEHPMVTALYEGNKRPAYIPSHAFAGAVLDLVGNSATGIKPTLGDLRQQIEKMKDNTHIQTILTILLNEGGDDIEKFRANIEWWFSESMERVSGWYKRKTHTVILIVAVLITCLSNADTVMVVNQLAKETALRTALVGQAEGFSAMQGNVQSSQKDSQRKSIDMAAQLQLLENLGLKLGWRADPDGTSPIPGSVGEWIYKILGLALTACAVSLGAPF
jgi:hypothetical protein